VTENFNIQMVENDADAKTIGEYLWMLGEQAWDIKRPFGNSDWQHELAESLYRAGKLKNARFITHETNGYTWEEFDFDYKELWSVVRDIYKEMWNKINDGN